MHDEAAIAELLSGLPPAPDAWVRAAQELRIVRHELEGLVRRATQDAAFRSRLIADLESALREGGLEPSPARVRALRRRLEAV